MVCWSIIGAEMSPALVQRWYRAKTRDLLSVVTGYTGARNSLLHRGISMHLVIAHDNQRYANYFHWKSLSFVDLLPRYLSQWLHPPMNISDSLPFRQSIPHPRYWSCRSSSGRYRDIANASPIGEVASSCHRHSPVQSERILCSVYIYMNPWILDSSWPILLLLPIAWPRIHLWHA